jgi:hypothetical protein
MESIVLIAVCTQTRQLVFDVRTSFILLVDAMILRYFVSYFACNTSIELLLLTSLPVFPSLLLY